MQAKLSFMLKELTKDAFMAYYTVGNNELCRRVFIYWNFLYISFTTCFFAKIKKGEKVDVSSAH